MQDHFCAECGAALPAKASFCDMCGTVVQREDALAVSAGSTAPDSSSSFRPGPYNPSDSDSLKPPARRGSRRLFLAAIGGTIALGVSACKIYSVVSSLMEKNHSTTQSQSPNGPAYEPPPGTIIYAGHTAAVVGVCWSPNGKLIASGSQDKTVQVWGAATGKPLFTYRGHTDEITSVAWAPAGDQIASAGMDHTLQVWNATTGLPTFQVKNDAFLGFFAALAWSPDGTLLAAASADNQVTVWDIAKRKSILTYKGHTYPANGVAWSPDGKLLASSGTYDKMVQICDVKSGKTMLTHTTSSNFVTAVAWSPDGKYIVSGEGRSTQINVAYASVWDAATGTLINNYGYQYYSVTSLAWSPDSARIASASADNTVQILQFSTGNAEFTYRGHNAPVNSVAWSPDGLSLASGSSDTRVHVWQPAN